MGQVKEMKNAIEFYLLNIYTNIGMDKPSNHDDILEFIANDVIETADPINWHSGDVSIGFRRWIESNVQPQETKIPTGLKDSNNNIIYVGDNVQPNIWSQINSDHEDEGEIHIDGYLTDDDNEEGTVIAKVRMIDNEVTYYDERAKTDKYAQEVITECFKRL